MAPLSRFGYRPPTSMIVLQLRKEIEMSLMCPMEGCKAKRGMCIHEKMMMFVVIMAAAGGLVYWLK